MFEVVVDKDKCSGDEECVAACPAQVFEMVDGKYLRCDLCGTIWDIETLQGLSGGCMNFPPPKLTTGIMNGVVIEAGSIGLEF